MKTIARICIGILLSTWIWGCSTSRYTSNVANDTYLTAKERAKLNHQSNQSYSSDTDNRDDNYQEREYDDYTYTRRIRRYYNGVWHDPWFDPWWFPSWTWCSVWWSPVWGWRWHTGWAMMPGWYYTPGWGWTYYAGPTWHDFGWTGGMYAKRYNYTPRTYTTTSGNTTYKPPRSNSFNNPTVNPPRRTTVPDSRPYYVPSSPRTTTGTAKPR